MENIKKQRNATGQSTQRKTMQYTTPVKQFSSQSRTEVGRIGPGRELKILKQTAKRFSFLSCSSFRSTLRLPLSVRSLAVSSARFYTLMPSVQMKYYLHLVGYLQFLSASFFSPYFASLLLLLAIFLELDFLVLFDAKVYARAVVVPTSNYCS